MAETNVPSVTFGPEGFVAPTQAQILAGRQADIDAAFGGGVNPSLDTPQGQIATTDAAIIGQANDTFLYQSTQTDPSYAEGRWQDAIGRIYFLERNPSEPTVVVARCSGLTGVVIPLGALARADDQNVYVCTQAGIIADTGYVDLQFSCSVDGPIPCAAGSLNRIYRAIPGWDSIINLADGVIGANTESRAAFEERRRASVALNARGILDAVQGAVLDVSGVLDAYVTENTAATPVVIGGQTLAAKSLYVAAVGGSSEEIAKAIWTKKAPGCDYNGNTTVTVYDDGGLYSPPLPSYDVKFQVPAPLPILFAVNMANNVLVPANAVQLVQAAIIAAFTGADGGARARIGSTIYATRYVGAVVSLGSWATVISLSVGSSNNPAASFNGSIAGTALTVSSGTGIAIGQTVSATDNSVLPGTVITAGSGTSWTVSRSQAVATKPMTTQLANRDSLNVNINQVPTISADNIAVTVT